MQISHTTHIHLSGQGSDFGRGSLLKYYITFNDMYRLYTAYESVWISHNTGHFPFTWYKVFNWLFGHTTLPLGIECFKPVVWRDISTCHNKSFAFIKGLFIVCTLGMRQMIIRTILWSPLFTSSQNPAGNLVANSGKTRKYQTLHWPIRGKCANRTC